MSDVRVLNLEIRNSDRSDISHIMGNKTKIHNYFSGIFYFQ